MYTIFMNSENSKTCEPYRILLYLADKIYFNRSDKYVALSNLNVYYIWKNMKKHTKIINLKYCLKHGIKIMIYLMDCIMYQVFKISLNISYKNTEKE